MVSVIVPVYRVEREYLEQCVSSIMKQSMNEWELLLVDDGAPAEIRKLLEEQSRMDNRIRVLHQENRGAAAARNYGLSESSGKYVLFVDSDDYIAEDTLKCLYDRAEKDELQILLFGAYKFDSKKSVEYTPYTRDIQLLSASQKEQLQMKTMVGYLPVYEYPSSHSGSGSTQGKLYRIDFLKENGLHYPVEMKRAEDVNFNIRAFEAADRIGYINGFFYFYRIYKGSASYKYREDAVNTLAAALNGLKSFICEHDKSEFFLQVYYMRCIFFFLESLDTYFLHKDNRKSFSLRMTEMKEAMQSEPYRTAIENISYRNLTAARKIPVFLMRHRMAVVLSVFYKGYEAVKSGRL